MAEEGMEVGTETPFDACHKAALAWLERQSPPSGWQLLWADDTDCQLVFEHPTGVSFKIALVSSAIGIGQQSFKVSSDNDSVWSLLKDCQGRSIQECLEWSVSTLKPLAGSPDTKSEGDEVIEDNDDDDEDDGDDVGYDYYDNIHDDGDTMETEEPVEHKPHTRKKSPDEEENVSDTEMEMYTKSGSKMAIHRLISDLKMFKRSSGTYGIHGSPRGDNLFLWDVQLTDFEQKSVLSKDLAKYAEKYQQKPEIQLEMSFPSDYPMSPPFIRVIRPRFKFLTAHVTIGGSICMELLTKSGWRPTNDIESILVQVRAEITSDPKAGLDMSNANRVYTKTEAETAFTRMVQRYGWNK